MKPNFIVATAATTVLAVASIGAAVAQANPPPATTAHQTDELHSGYPNPGARSRDVDSRAWPNAGRRGTDEIFSGVPNPGYFPERSATGASQAPRPAGIDHQTDEMHSGYPNPRGAKK